MKSAIISAILLSFVVTGCGQISNHRFFSTNIAKKSSSIRLGDPLGGTENPFQPSPSKIIQETLTNMESIVLEFYYMNQAFPTYYFNISNQPTKSIMYEMQFHILYPNYYTSPPPHIGTAFGLGNKWVYYGVTYQGIVFLTTVPPQNGNQWSTSAPGVFYTASQPNGISSKELNGSIPG